MIVQISPLGSLDLLAKVEVEMLKKKANSEIYHTFRSCILATLNAGVKTDDTAQLIAQYNDFEVNLVSTERGIKLELVHPPLTAFVDHKIIRSIQANLYSVIRDILFVNTQINSVKSFFPHLENEQERSDYITNLVFAILRNAKALHVGEDPSLIVCWGGHSINDVEYEYAKLVGLELGLRELNICTGCGPGVMEAPMKGAAIGHAQQRNTESRFIGMTEVSIMAAEPPNSLVNELIIMPDIEKRLEAFVRISHGILIFPGGPGTAEELLYILGILLLPENEGQVLPLVLTGPKESEAYFQALDDFILATLGAKAQSLYQIIIDDPIKVAQTMKKGTLKIKADRLKTGDAYSFNWGIKLSPALQLPFDPTHENMKALNLHKNQSVESLAADLRRAFSGIVAGNIKSEGISRIAEQGPYLINGDLEIMQHLDKLLTSFVKQDRMKFPDGKAYKPCYKICYS